MAEQIDKFIPVINKPVGNGHKASVIFLHGSGGTGKSLQERIQEKIDFCFPEIKVIFPSAPLMSYTLLGGAPSNVWFDRTSLEPDGRDQVSSVDSMAHQLSKIIEAEVQSGVPKNKIIIAGYSMGACMALHLGLRFQQDVAGIIALSNFLYKDSEVYKVLRMEKPKTLPPILMCHGKEDDLIFHEWGLDTKERLNSVGVTNISFHSFDHLDHDLSKEELSLVHSWIMKILSDNQ